MPWPRIGLSWLICAISACISIPALAARPAETVPATRSTPAPSTQPTTRPDDARANGALPAPPEPRPGAPAARAVNSEVIGLKIQGRRSRERLSFDDMERLVTPGAYLLPVMALANVFEAKVTEQDGRYVVESAAGRFVLDPGRQEIETPQGRKGLQIVVTATELSNRIEVFIPTAAIDEIFGIQTQWKEEEYAYVVHVNRTLKIWQIRRVTGPAARQLTVNLPELHPQAGPETSWLQMMQYNVRAQYDVRWQKPDTTETISASPPVETIWGRALGGAYKLTLSQPGYIRQDGDAEWSSQYPDVRVDWASIAWRADRYELTLGDHYVGLTRLAFPRATLTGAKLVALSGFTDSELEDVTNLSNLSGLYDRPHVIEGLARIGSRVELFINDRLSEVQEAVAEKDTPPGIGRYRFEDIRIPSGSLVETRIVITEPDGTVQKIARDFMDTRVLLPAGRAVYLAEAGTRRRISGYRDLDAPRERVSAGQFLGKATMGRALYGLTDNLTVGLAGAVEENLYVERGAQSVGDRDYPTSSSHLGVPVYWNPSPSLLMSGEVGLSGGDSPGDESYNDHAEILSWQYFPIRKVTLAGEVYSYGQHYFDGVDPDLRNRRGYDLTGQWDVTDRIRLSGALGGVGWVRQEVPSFENYMDYGTVEAFTSLLPRTNINVGIDAMRASSDQPIYYIRRMRLTTGPWAGIEGTLETSAGNDLAQIGRNLLENLPLRGTPDYLTPYTTLDVRKWINNDHRVGVRYTKKEDGEERVWAYHTSRFHFKWELDVENAVGRELNTASNLFSSRIDLHLDPEKNHTVGFRADYEDREWRATFFISSTDLMAMDRGTPVLLNRRRANPDSGAIHGLVFVDYNANGVLDKGEEGVEGVDVVTDARRRTTTDSSGHYVLPAPSNAKTTRVSLDIATLPAIYSVVHGTQEARITPGNLTRVDLAVAPITAVTGKVMGHDSQRKLIPVAGARVRVLTEKDRKLVSESITASDGTYYLSELKPGNYFLSVDDSTLPPSMTIDEPERRLKVAPNKDFIDVQGPIFQARQKSEESQTLPAQTQPTETQPADAQPIDAHTQPTTSQAPIATSDATPAPTSNQAQPQSPRALGGESGN
jgi:hypothetical protein